MKFLDLDILESLDATRFRAAKPYPWINPQGLLTEDGFGKLAATLPDMSLFEEQFGLARSHGQMPHDRYSLEYRDDLAVPECWHAFVAELRSDAYRSFLRRMMGMRPKRLRYFWRFSPGGASVSPHCDAKRKLGSHIFYLNSPEDWEESWGGQTEILDDHGRFPRKSAPRFEDFAERHVTRTLGNRSLLFARRTNSWHGVKAVHCPAGHMRKIFLVVIDDAFLSFKRTLLGPFKGKRTGPDD